MIYKNAGEIIKWEWLTENYMVYICSQAHDNGTRPIMHDYVPDAVDTLQWDEWG